MATELNMRHVSLSFPGVKALDGVDFAALGGEIHALLGANGAGKSTLMKVLTGAYLPDEGTIEIAQKRLEIQNPADAIKHGIHCVYQEVDAVLVPDLSVGENIVLDQMADPHKGQWLRWRKLKREAQSVLARLEFPLDIARTVRGLSLAEKQMVVIARALLQKAKFIIFDEPTAPLGVEETNRLFNVMAQLKDAGVGCIFISHRLAEVFQISDRITVMRDGKRVATKQTAMTNVPEIVELMLGKPLQEEFPKITVPPGKLLLEAEGLTRGNKVKHVGLRVREGEIVGVTGFVGAGKTELSRLLFGADRLEKGTIYMKGKPLKLAHPDQAVRAGIVLVPEERRKQGILIAESVARNLSLLTLRRLSRFGFVRRKLEETHAEAVVRDLGIKTPHVRQTVAFLSGGNQQKVAVGKWLPTEAEVYLFDEPTKGVDIGAKSDIFRLIGQLAQKGKGIIYFSSEFEEILGIADRILVMCNGEIVKELSREEATSDLLLLYACGEGRTEE
ncbi:MAG TPA: sugar ABC transporter ATP-binding protein [Bacilli bacterium]